MFKKFLLLFFLQSLTLVSISAQDSYPKNEHADVQQYKFYLKLSDKHNRIEGKTEMKVNFSGYTDLFAVDLVAKNGNYGMEVLEVLEDGKAVKYHFKDNSVLIKPTVKKNIQHTYSIKYHGIPEKGLVIDTTKYGQRSFFGDNWPNLARHWLACVDHPYDKAAVEFHITAPEHYEVVATGKKSEESHLGGGLKLTSYIEPSPVATKVMTIGVTRFATKHLGSYQGIDISAWVYPENRLQGFGDFQEAPLILAYFEKNIGPYSYAKLANIQAKTQWGGLENAGTITYYENGITGKKELQRLMAHEIAHQWFGNSITEANWNHVWLSEGFATYFAVLYQESVWGQNKRKEEMIEDRGQVISYYTKNPTAIINHKIDDPNLVLTTNSYQKGGWVLHMLRHELGDELFWTGIRSYHKKYKDANAETEDFKEVMEKVSAKDLKSFFHQWLYVKGHPELKWKWTYKKGTLIISVQQVQKHFTFQFPIEFAVNTAGKTALKKFLVNSSREQFVIELDKKPDSVVIDPEVWLLFDEK